MLSVALTCRRPRFEVSASFAVGDGELLGILGPSGAGKSTILTAIAGLLRPQEGTVRLGEEILTDVGNGRDVFVPPWRRRIALLTQEAVGFPHLKVGQNIAFGLSGRRLDSHARALTAAFGLEPLLDRRIGEISGGERRRVALAQMLAIRPRALLLDEPFSALDAPVRLALGEQVRAVQRQAGFPAVLVSHDLTELQRLCDYLLVLFDGQTQQIGRPDEIVRCPANPTVARLAGYADMLPGELVGMPGTVLAVHPDRVRLGAFPTLGPVVRARLVRAAPEGAGWRLQWRTESREQACFTCRVVDLTAPPDTDGVQDLTLVSPPRFTLQSPPPWRRS